MAVMVGLTLQLCIYLGHKMISWKCFTVAILVFLLSSCSLLPLIRVCALYSPVCYEEGCRGNIVLLKRSLLILSSKFHLLPLHKANNWALF
jgi:hypothetical protein